MKYSLLQLIMAFLLLSMGLGVAILGIQNVAFRSKNAELKEDNDALKESAVYVEVEGGHTIIYYKRRPYKYYHKIQKIELIEGQHTTLCPTSSVMPTSADKGEVDDIDIQQPVRVVE